jgi:hypothetical protein
MNYIGDKVYNDFIVGEKFYTVADFIYSTDNIEDYNKLVSTFDITKLKELNIVYLHTMYKDYFFEMIKNLENKFIVVTHNSDMSADNVDIPKNVIKWYSQNVNVKDDRLESLPIGLENSRWFPEIKKQSKIIEKVRTAKNIRNLVYMSHNVNTNIKERTLVFNVLKDKKFVTNQSTNFDLYIDNIYNHKFVICPEGNGIDTHRTWETLYLGSIPIEKRNINNQYYTDLPICFVDNWEEVTEDFLNKEWERITQGSWNLAKLNFQYWKKRIKVANYEN